MRPQETLERVEFRAAKPRDIDGLLALYELFFAESELSSFGLVLDPARGRNWIDNAICGGRYPHVLAVDKSTDTIIGSIAYALNHDYSEKPFAEMDKFYVHRSWRRSAIGVTLLTLALEAAKGDGAVYFRAYVNAGIDGADKLFKKFGFRETPNALLLGKEL